MPKTLSIVAISLQSILLSISAHAQSVDMVVDCARTTGAVERALCETPGLMRLNSEVSRLTARLESSLSGVDREALIDTERPVLRSRNGCTNEVHTGDPAAYRKGLETCIERVLEQRRAALAAALTAPSSMQEEIGRQTLVDPPFFNKYSEVLVGKRLQLFGCLLLDPGASNASRTVGSIQESCEAKGSPSVRVVFRNMTDKEASFLDRTVPTSWWRGIVERRDGLAILFLEDILGRPLP